MSNFANSLNFLQLQEGLKQLGLDPSWCNGKDEAVNAISLYFEKNNLELEYQCPSCGGDLPEIEICPYCGETFKEVEQEKSYKEKIGVFNLRENNEPIEKNVYGDITVYKLQHRLKISLVNPFGWQAYNEILRQLFIPECLIHKHKYEEKYSIKDPWSERRPFEFVRTLVVVNVYNKNIMLQFGYPKQDYGEYEYKLKNYRKPIRRLRCRFSINNKEDLAIGIKLIADTFKLSKDEHEGKSK